MSSTVFMPKKRHRCQTPGSLRPQSDWPMRVMFGKEMRAPVMWPVGAMWMCPHCGRWWRAHDLPPNPPGGGYYGGGRVWKKVRHPQRPAVPSQLWFSLFAVLVSLVAVLMSVALLLGWWR